VSDKKHPAYFLLFCNKHIDSPAQRANIFLRYMFERNIEQEFIGLYGIGIIERISPAKKQAFVDEMSDFYGTPFNVKSIGDRPAENTDHWIISTVYPARNNSAIGLDVTSETKRYAAIMQSLLSVQRQTTGYISLVQIDNTKEYGYLSYQPVVAADGQIRYVVYALTTYLYMFEKLGTHVLESFTLQPVQISVFDRSTRQCLMRYTTGSGGLTCNKTDRVDESIALQHVLELDKELYVITPSPKYVAYSMRNTHWITAIVGVFLSLLGVFYVRRLRYEKVLLTQRVSERTQELQHSLQEVQVAEKVKQEFLQKVSHELRTPLNGIMGVLQILTQDIDQPKQKQLLQLAEGAAFHLMGLVEDILDTAKFNHGTFILSKIAFELKPYLLNIVHMLEPWRVLKT
jgi:CHASE1-domain containing sensor protein